jgi:catechol 2,3-dioxygenase-like lactoylglutathione lyase family enzyme
VNLNQVTLPVNNMDKSTKFYRDLGFTQIVDAPHYARFECPEGDDWVNKLKVKGFSFDQEPTDQSYLWREAILHDPSGNKIKLYWAGENRINPPWRVEIRT